MVHHPLQLHDICNLKKERNLKLKDNCNYSYSMQPLIKDDLESSISVSATFKSNPSPHISPYTVLYPWWDNRPLQMLSLLS